MNMKIKFYTKRGGLTSYAISCGYVEHRKGLTLSMESYVYFVKGFNKGFHISKGFHTLTEARSYFRSFP